MKDWKRGGLVWGVLLTGLLICSVAQASITTITLDVSPSTPTSGNWSALDLVEIIIQASSDGGAGQGFSGADFLTGARGIFVDTNKVKIHDILFSTLQVDTEQHATAFNGDGGYSKAGDTWVYDYFTDFEGSVLMADGSFEAVAGGHVLGSEDLGRVSPVNFLHVVFEIQPGFVLGESTTVTFTGQVCAYGQILPDQVWSDLFGVLTESDDATGSFDLTVTPEPTTAMLLLAGVASIAARRRRRR